MVNNSLIFIVLHVWLFMLILLSGDVEVNPGPDSVESSTDSSDILSSASLNSLSNHLSILHLNIQSLLPKIDLIRGEANYIARHTHLYRKLAETHH